MRRRPLVSVVLPDAESPTITRMGLGISCSPCVLPGPNSIDSRIWSSESTHSRRRGRPAEVAHPLGDDLLHRLARGRLEEARGSNSEGVAASDSRSAAVIARRPSVSTLTLRTPWRMPCWISSTGTPKVASSSAAGGVDAVDELSGHARGAVHDHVGAGSFGVDLLDQVHREHLAVGLLGELVGAVARTDRDRERVDAGAG